MAAFLYCDSILIMIWFFFQSMEIQLEDKVTCMECGKQFSLINNRHLDSHNLTQADYESKHPGATLRSAASLAKKKESATRANAHRIGVPLSAEVIKNQRDNRKSSNKGKKYVPFTQERKDAASLRVKEEFSSGYRTHHMLGKHHSEETKEKISKSLSEKE
jgi:hydroxylamine reductase (hybrid-cluster protein)